MTPHPVDVAVRSYYWKPSMAWFRALELDIYLDADVRLDGPTLDVGCGDGRVAKMLKELFLVEGPIHGIELSSRLLDEARKTGAHASLGQADAGRLPYPGATFDSALCNGVLCSIQAGPTLALSEIHRVLRPNGMMVATFPTDRFHGTLLLHRLLGFWPWAREAYGRGVDRRQPHFTAEPISEWRARFEAAGFEVVRVLPFFSELGGGLWNVMAMHVFRVFGALKLAPVAHSPVRRFLSRAFRRLFEQETRRNGSGYALFVVRKPPNGPPR